MISGHNVNDSELAPTVTDVSLPILVLNGVNLNMLGAREPHIYGSFTIDDVNDLCAKTAARYDAHVVCYQSNHEGDFIDRIHQARGQVRAIVINPGAWTHTSLAIADAIAIADVPIIEVHISQVYAREAVRQTSYISPKASAVISGCGIYGYAYALEQAIRITSDNA